MPDQAARPCSQNGRVSPGRHRQIPLVTTIRYVLCVCGCCLQRYFVTNSQDSSTSPPAFLPALRYPQRGSRHVWNNDPERPFETHVCAAASGLTPDTLARCSLGQTLDWQSPPTEPVANAHTGFTQLTSPPGTRGSGRAFPGHPNPAFSTDTTSPRLDRCAPLHQRLSAESHWVSAYGSAAIRRWTHP